jgi:hypothetical protein
MAVYACTIAGVSKNLQDGFSITRPANGRGSLTCEVVSRDGAYRPAIGAEIIITEDGTRIFGGNIDRPAEVIFAGHASASHTTRLTAVDFNALADRRYATISQNDASLHSWLTLITPYIPGATLDGAQPTGPTLPPITYTDRHVSSMLEELCVLAMSVTGTGWVWEVDYNKVLRMIESGTASAPFNVTDGDKRVYGDIVVEETRNDFANRIILKYGSGVQLKTDSFVGDGVTREFPLTVPIAGFPNPVTLNGQIIHVGIYGVDDIHAYVYRESDNTLVQLEEAPPGTPIAELESSDDLVVIYPAQYPATLYEPTSVPGDPYEKVVLAPDVYDPVVAQALADSLLNRDDAAYKTVEFDVFTGAWKPGQTFTVTNTQRNLSAVSCLVFDVSTRHERLRARRTVKAVVGGFNPSSWQDVFRQWGGGGGSNGTSVISGVPLSANGGVFPGYVYACKNGDGTNQLYETSLRFASKSSLGGPGTIYGEDGDASQGAVFADYLRNGAALDPGLVFNLAGQTQGAVHLRVYDTNKIAFSKVSSSTTFILGAKSSHGLGTFGHEIDEVNTDNCDSFNGYIERGRTAPMGEWTSPAYADSNFKGDGTDANWVVDSGDVLAYKYRIIGKSMLVAFSIATTDVANTPTSLEIVIPGSFTASGRADSVGTGVNAGATPEPVNIVVLNGASVISISRFSGTWSTTTGDNTNVTGQIEFEVA